MQIQRRIGQPKKEEASDLSSLYDFISECPNPKITAAISKLVNSWLEHASEIPHFSEELKSLLKMTDEELIEVCWLLAINPKTPPSVLNDLCSGASNSLLERIAENSSTGASTLAQLSFQAVAEIRIATASNPTTPLASIMLLVVDDNPDVRFSIAENPNVPKEALEALARDDNPYIKMRAEKTLLRSAVESNILSNPK